MNLMQKKESISDFLSVLTLRSTTSNPNSWTHLKSVLDVGGNTAFMFVGNLMTAIRRFGACGKQVVKQPFGRGFIEVHVGEKSSKSTSYLHLFTNYAGSLTLPTSSQLFNTADVV